MYGTSDNIIDGAIIYNLTSLREGYQRFQFLIPPNTIGYLTNREFDIAYYQYIMNNDIVFGEFFQIISALYNGNNVYIIISENDWSENLVESLMKVIQQRYGYNAGKINCYDDYLFMMNNKYYSEFDYRFGLGNLDSDKERYAILVEGSRIHETGGTY